MTEIVILRAYYLTGVGQENEAYYFKVPKDLLEIEEIGTDSIIMSFYQSENIITCIPAIARVDAVLFSEQTIQAALRQETKTGQPILPVIQVFDEFDATVYQSILDSCEQLKKEMRRLQASKLDKKEYFIQGDLFDFVEGGT